MMAPPQDNSASGSAGPASWFTRTFSKAPALLLLELFVAAALTVNFFYLVRPLCEPKPNGDMFSTSTFAYLSPKVGLSPKVIMYAWRTRVLAPALTATLLDRQLTQPVGPGSTFPNFLAVTQSSEFRNLFAAYHAAWLFLTFLALVLFRKDALLLIVGVFAGLMYNFADPVRTYCYPWDMPAMFCLTLAILLFDRRCLRSLLPVLVLGSLFKETVLCTSLLVLFVPGWNWWKRGAAFVGVIATTFLLNRLLMAQYNVHTGLLAMNNAVHWTDIVRNTKLWGNIQYFFHPALNHVLFANAGTLLIATLIPWRDRRDVLLKSVLLLFVAGQFLCGLILEVRIWQEVLPLGLILISEALARHRGVPDTATPDQRPWLRTHWLLLGALAVAAVLTYAIALLWTPRLSFESRPATEELQQLTAAAQTAKPESQFALARYYEAHADYDQAIAWYEKAAEQGHVKAGYQLGMIFMNIRNDYPSAAKWLGLAAAAGHVDAKYRLAFIRWDGPADIRDPQQGLDLLQEAAWAGSAQAQYALGTLLREGNGVQQNFEQAYVWFKLAGVRGDRDVRSDLAGCAAKLSPAQITNAEAQVKRFQERIPPAP